MVQALDMLNVRGGPGTEYAIVDGLDAGEQAAIAGKSPAGDWWQIALPTGQQGWVLGQLVQTTGDTSAVAVAANIPAPPPTATPAPVAAAPVAPTEAAAAPDPAAQPAETPTAAAPAPPPSDQPHFTLIERRLWNKQENDGCIGKHLLRIHVFDANGNRLNGVTLEGIYGAHEVFVTGAQGKGDGIIEFDLYGSGQGFRVVRDADGREATSDSAEGFTTRSMDIPKDVLIAAGYCTDSADCDVFYASFGCMGHHSWEAKFQRNY